MKKFLREPLTHFLLIGAALFVVFDTVNERASGTENTRIFVSEGRIAQLQNIFSKTWQRPPSTSELKGLIDDFILEEIYYRQAIAMGIDRDDTVIRRRLRQKLEFLTDDMTAATAVTDAELDAYLAANKEVFWQETTYTFKQVYISPERFVDAADAHLAETLEDLRSGREVTAGGGLLPNYFESAPEQILDRTFGSAFSTNLDALSVGEWQGPVRSGLGLHFVFIEARDAGSLPELADIRSVVEREWSNAKRLEMRQRINEQLLGEYDVVVEWPST